MKTEEQMEQEYEDYQNLKKLEDFCEAQTEHLCDCGKQINDWAEGWDVCLECR